MLYEIIPPPEILKGWVRHFWVLQLSNGYQEMPLKLYADPYPLLTFQCNEDKRLIRDVDGTYLSDLFLAGIKTKPVHFMVCRTYSQVAVSFYPNAIGRLFDAPPHTFVDRFCDLTAFCPGTLVERLRNSRDMQERIQHLSEFFIARLPSAKRGDPALEDFIHGKHNLETWDLKSLVSGYRVSERQLERKFKASLGISPKKYLRIIRFERALKMLRGNSFGKLSNIAFDLGYSDPAAFTNDFRNSSGFSPNAYLDTKKVVEYESSFAEE